MPNIPAGTQVKDLSTVAGRISAAWDALNGRAFGPGVPIAPASDLVEQTEGPRQYQYPISLEYALSASGGKLRANYRFNSFVTWPGSMTLQAYRSLPVSKSYRVSGLRLSSLRIRSASKSYSLRVMRLSRFLPTPISSTTSHPGYRCYSESLFEIDAPTIFKRLDVGGRLHSLELFDG
jgi:hypothetical protein